MCWQCFHGWGIKQPLLERLERISFDPNLRPPLWKSLEEAREQVLFGLEHCHILKISDNEIQWLTGEEDYTAGVNWIYSRFHTPLILVSMGKEGSRAYYQNRVEHGLKDLSDEDLTEMLDFANCAASIITSRKGALRVMPAREEIDRERSGRR